MKSTCAILGCDKHAQGGGRATGISFRSFLQVIHALIFSDHIYLAFPDRPHPSYVIVEWRHGDRGTAYSLGWKISLYIVYYSKAINRCYVICSLLSRDNVMLNCYHRHVEQFHEFLGRCELIGRDRFFFSKASTVSSKEKRPSSCRVRRQCTWPANRRI